MDFLATTPAGDVQPFANVDVGGRTYVADSNGVIHGVTPNHSQSLLACGAVPLPPAGWTDHRAVVSADGKTITVK
jgi:hypothetical protein